MHRKRLLLFTGCITLMLMASGCFQQNADDSASLQVAQFGPTLTLEPTITPYPTLTPETIVITATPDANVNSEEFGVGGAFASNQQVGLESDTSLTRANDSLPQQDVQQEPGIDPLFITATYIVAQATVDAANSLTATAAAQGIGVQPTVAPILPTAGPGVIAPTALPNSACTYSVLQGDNLYRIGLKYGATPAEMAAVNPTITNINFLLVGQVLNIPNCNNGVVTTPIPSVGTTVDTSGTVVTGVTIAPGSSYTVQQGDTLFQISLRSGIPMASIAAANGLSDINVIVVNQVLQIPTG